ncbi:hypothetical protein N658DRAFT_495356 [Parathielavia hyrcaniae]|uniref:Uncharacterized protein n=1 Tax=Parathielavia hyrcaniae TaxID=113614 RepID=A0AAN6T3F0_9PEZI|nr:hypothetical protein N658DRAFT_495356 [Parathielavia hyrcaniae]
MASRFASSSLHQRDSRSDLFKGYTGAGSASRPVSASPSRLPPGGGYGYGGYQPSSSQQHLGLTADSRGGYRPATPNRKGQYSDAVLNELESQNDQQVEGIMGKVKMLKDVSFYTLRSRLHNTLPDTTVPERAKLTMWLLNTDDGGHRRRDTGFVRAGGEDERGL